MIAALSCLLRHDPEGAADGMAQVSGWMLGCARLAAEQAQPDVAALARKLAASEERNTSLEAQVDALTLKLGAAGDPPDPQEVRDSLSDARDRSRELVAYLTEQLAKPSNGLAGLYDPLDSPEQRATDAAIARLAPTGPVVTYTEGVQDPPAPACGHAICDLGPCVRIRRHPGACQIPAPPGSAICAVCRLVVSADHGPRIQAF